MATASETIWVISILKWLGRLVGLFLVLAVIALSISMGERFPNPFRASFIINLEYLAFFSILIGFLLAWRYELAGSLLSVAAIASFYLASYARVGRFPAPGPLLFAFVPPMLFFAHQFAILGQRSALRWKQRSQANEEGRRTHT
jgi:hypothetical protein